MNVTIDIELQKANVSLEWLMIFSLLYEKKFNVLNSIHSMLNNNLVVTYKEMQDSGYVKILGPLLDGNELLSENVSLREKGMSLVYNDALSLDEFVRQYRELFPANYKGEQQGCKNKMRLFLKRYRKKYSPETILKATKLYLDQVNPTYRKQAHYFIIKDGISDLAIYCDKVLDGSNGRIIVKSGSDKL